MSMRISRIEGLKFKTEHSGARARPSLNPNPSWNLSLNPNLSQSLNREAFQDSLV